LEQHSPPFPFGIPLSAPVRGWKDEKRASKGEKTEVIKLFCKECLIKTGEKNDKTEKKRELCGILAEL